jgi:hypothetical protein
MARSLQGVQQKLIGIEFEMPPATVGHIVRGETWKHLFLPGEGA